MDTLYYDGKCPLCNREITFLKQHADKLAFIDIHSLDANHNPSIKTLLRTLHLKQDNDTWVSGVDATVQSWQHTPYCWVVKPLKWPIMHNVAKTVYAYWAKKRYCNLYD